MKNLSKFLIVASIIVCCVETACNKQENLFTPAPGNNSSLKSVSNGGHVFIVSPSSDMKDSEALLEAFNAALDFPGSTVQLTEGTFVLDKRIEVEGFVGSFKGAGKEKTIITTPDEPVNFDLLSADWESLIKFRHGNINVSDFTIKITNPHPCKGILDNWTDGFPSILMFTGNSVNEPPATEQAVSFTLKNVKFIGLNLNHLENGIPSFNVGYCVNIAYDGYLSTDYYDLVGSYKITNCEFLSLNASIWSTFNGICEVGGDNYSTGNKFEDTNFGVLPYDCSNSVYNISNNSFKKINVAAVQVIQVWNTIPAVISKFLIRNNYMDFPGNGTAIWLADLSISINEGKKIDAVVSGNQIHLNSIEWGEGIWGGYAKDVLVTNNRIWGNCLAGIDGSNLDGEPVEETSGWIIKGNNVQGVNAWMAPIWLNSSSHDNIVIGGANKTNVFDEGTDNILTGVNNMKGNPLGPQIKAAMERRMEMMKLIKGRTGK